MLNLHNLFEPRRPLYLRPPITIKRTPRPYNLYNPRRLQAQDSALAAELRLVLAVSARAADSSFVNSILVLFNLTCLIS